MRPIVRVVLSTHWGEFALMEIEKVERPACQLQADTLGLCLRDGKWHQVRWTPRTPAGSGAYAMVNGDLAERQRVHVSADAEDISPETSQSLDVLQRAAV